MATYSIRAPNGQTYEIDGPEGASDAQVRAEVMRQHPDAGGSAKPAPAPLKANPPSIMSELGRAAWNAPRDAAEVTKGFMQQFGPEGLPAHVVMHPVQSAVDAGSFVHHAADVLQGGLERGRQAMPVTPLTGNAPHRDTTAFDNFAGSVKDQYGSVHGALKTFADHPAGTILSAAALLDPALRAANVEGGVLGATGRAAQAAGGAVKRTATGTAAKVSGAAETVADKVQPYTTAKRRSAAVSGQMRDEATGVLKATQADASNVAAGADDAALKAQLRADRLAARRTALEEQRAKAASQSARPELRVAEPRHKTQMGESLRAPAVAKEEELNASMRAADAQYRAAMDDIAKDREAAGVGVSDTETAKALVKQSREATTLDPLKNGPIGSVPTKEVASLHQKLIDTLTPENVKLTKEQAWQARNEGKKVQYSKEHGYSMQVKPDLKKVDEFRRLLADIRDGRAGEGYSAIHQREAARMYGDVSKVISEYTEGANEAVQANWRAGKEALEPFERVRAGKNIVGTQAGTDVATVPAANIPGRVLAGGRDTIQQTAEVSGRIPVRDMLRSHVQNELSGLKTSEQVRNAIRHGSTLGESLTTDPDLLRAVQTHAAKLQLAEEAEARAARIEGITKRLDARTERLNASATSSRAAAAKATAAARRAEADLSKLTFSPPDQVGPQYVHILEQAHAEGRLSSASLDRGRQLANYAEKAFKQKATRDAWLKRALKGMGLGATGALGYDITKSVVGN